MKTRNLLNHLLQLAAIIGLTAMALAQTELATERQDVVVEEESNDTPKANAASPGILKKFEDWVGLTNTKLEDLAAMADRLQVEIAKMKTQHSEAASAIPKPAPATAPLLNNPVDLPVPQDTLATTQAEIDRNDSFDLVVGEVGETAPLPVLNSSTPEWVKNGLVLGEEHSLAISSNLFSDLEQCREDLKARMMADVQTYLDKHVLKSASADQLPELTEEYVEKYWVKKGQEFDNIQDRPSGVYHQLWIGLHISSEQLAKVHKWEKQCVRAMRTKKVGVFGGLSVIALSLLSGAVGVLARREKAKLR